MYVTGAVERKTTGSGALEVCQGGLSILQITHPIPIMDEQADYISKKSAVKQSNDCREDRKCIVEKDFWYSQTI